MHVLCNHDNTKGINAYNIRSIGLVTSSVKKPVIEILLGKQTVDISDSIFVVVVDSCLRQRLTLLLIDVIAATWWMCLWWWTGPFKHGLLELPVEHLDETVRVTVVVNAAAVTRAPAQHHQVEPPITRVHQVPRVPVHHIEDECTIQPGRLLYTVSQKSNQNYCCHNFVKFPRTVIIFDTKTANSLKLNEVHTFSTSTNSRQRTTVLNANVPICHTTL